MLTAIHKAIATLIPVLSLMVVGTANASVNVNYSTGASVDANGVDQNWKFFATDNPSFGNGPLNPPRNAFVLKDQWPIGSAWLANDSNSKWISYSDPLVTTDPKGHTDAYLLTFSTTGGSAIPIRWLSDNISSLTLDGNTIGKALAENSFSSWNTATIANLSPGSHDLLVTVYNMPQATGNPTGARVEFFAPVPEPSTIMAGALLLLPFGASAWRSIRRNRE